MSIDEARESAGYALVLSEQERARYRFMAESARAEEQAAWTSAGIVPGARVADIGCGPGAVLAVLAQVVGGAGRADGVDRDTDALATASAEIAELPQASVRAGAATASGLEPGTYDVVMCRHVLAHNGGNEPAIVAHLVDLLRPGGALYLVDVDLSMMRLQPEEPDLSELRDRYAEFHRARGNDPAIGLRLADLLEAAGLSVESFRSGGPVVRVPPGVRPPPWSARDLMVAEGVATEADVARWQLAIDRLDAAETRPWLCAGGVFRALGRKG